MAAEEVGVAACVRSALPRGLGARPDGLAAGGLFRTPPAPLMVTCHYLARRCTNAGKVALGIVGETPRRKCARTRELGQGRARRMERPIGFEPTVNSSASLRSPGREPTHAQRGDFIPPYALRLGFASLRAIPQECRRCGRHLGVGSAAGFGCEWSARSGSNRRHSAWEAEERRSYVLVHQGLSRSPKRHFAACFAGILPGASHPACQRASCRSRDSSGPALVDLRRTPSAGGCPSWRALSSL